MRRQKYRGQLSSEFTRLGVFVFLSYIAFQALKSEHANFDITSALFKLIVWLTFGFAILALIYFLVFYLKKLFQKLERSRLYQIHRSLEEVRAQHPKEVEKFVAGIYEKFGYKTEEVTQYVKDHGIDVILRKGNLRYAVQVKRYAKHNPVTEPETRGFYGSYTNNDFDQGILVTTSRFTNDARKWAKKRHIILVEGPELVKMMRTYDKE